MVSIELPSLFNSVVGAAGLYLVYCIYWELTTGAARRKMIRENGCLPAQMLPDWDPFFGWGSFFKTRESIKDRRGLELTKHRFGEMGINTFGINFGFNRFLLTIEPENLKAMQATDFKNWSLGARRKKYFTPFLGLGIFTTDGSEWQHSREMLRPNFHRSQVSDLPMFEEHIQDLIGMIPKDGSVVDLQELFFRLTMDSATEVLFGTSTKTLAPGTEGQSPSVFADHFNGGQEGISARSRFGWMSIFYASRMDHHVKYVHDWIDVYVRAAVARKHETKEADSRYVFLDELVQRIDDPIRIRSELLNILLAGRDTTASLLSNVFHTLARRPDVFAKLHEEVASLNGELPTWQQLKELKYLKAVLNESLRLYPVVPGNSRQATADTTLPKGGGPDGQSPLFIPKDQIMIWSVYTMHRRKDFYGADADEFKPERWMGEKGLRPGWEYLPFNGGARICLGQQFALTEASYTVVRLLQEFKAVETTDTRPWTEWLTLTCTNAYGLPMKLTPA